MLMQRAPPSIAAYHWEYLRFTYFYKNVLAVSHLHPQIYSAVAKRPSKLPTHAAIFFTHCQSSHLALLWRFTLSWPVLTDYHVKLNGKLRLTHLP